MCAKPEPADTYRTLADLIDDLIVDDYAWAGVRLYFGLLESV